MQNLSKMLKSELIEYQLLDVNKILEDLTDSELKVFRSLIQYIRKNSYTPTLLDLGNELGMSKQGVDFFFKKLQEKGYIKRIGRGRIALTYKDADVVVENLDKLMPALEKLKEAHDRKLITKEEYEAKKKLLLGI